MQGSLIISRLNEINEGSYTTPEGVEYQIDRDGCMVRVIKRNYTSVVARKGAKNGSV
jgi:hypothetical protein